MSTPPTFPDCVPRLTDGVVTLRAHTEDDVPALYEQSTDSVMLRWTTLPDPSTPETATELATQGIPAGWRTGSEWAYAVEAPDEDGAPRFVGTVSLRDEGHTRAEVAFGAHPWSRGRGYVVRALELLLDWGFRERGLRTVIWWADQGNWASRKVAWRVGFSFDGTVRRWLPRHGELRDAWVGVLTAQDERRPRSPWLEVPRLAGPGVVLRRLRETDVPRIVEACSDETTSSWLTHLPAPYTARDAHDYLERQRELLATGAGLSWAVSPPEDDVLAGLVTVFDIDPGDDAEVGYWMHPGVRARGLATAACALAVRHAFVPSEDGGLGLRRLRAEVAEGNDVSRRVLEGNGFTATGRQRAARRLRGGGTGDLLCYDLLAEEYSPAKREDPPG